MVVNSGSIAEQVIGSIAYKEMLSELVTIAGIEIEPEYSEVFARLDSAKISRAKLDAEELIGFLISNTDAIKKYSIDKLHAFSDDEDDEEYPVGSEPREDEKSKILSVGKYSQGFLLTNIIEYALVTAGREKLLEYVKSSRIPQAKKYTDQIVKLVNAG